MPQLPSWIERLPNPVTSFENGLSWGNAIYQNRLRAKQLQTDEEMKRQEMEAKQAEADARAREAAIKTQARLDFNDWMKARTGDSPDGQFSPDVAMEGLIRFGPDMFIGSQAYPSIVSGALNRESKADIEALRSQRAADLAEIKKEMAESKSESDYRRVLDAIDRRIDGQRGIQEMRGSQALEQIGAKGQNSLEQIDARAGHKLDQIDAEVAAGKYSHRDGNGKVVSEAQFIDRHLNSLLKQGATEGDAVQRLKAAYRQAVGKDLPAEPESDPEIDEIDAALKSLRADMMLHPGKKLLDFGEDDRQVQIKELEKRKKEALSKRSNKTKPTAATTNLWQEFQESKFAK